MASNAKGHKKKGRTAVVNNTEPMDSDNVSISNHGDHRTNEESQPTVTADCPSSSTDPPPSSFFNDDVEMEAPTALVEIDPKLVAEERKVAGNAFYTKKEYATAVRLYTEAIDLCPTCAAYYGNRTAAYMMLNQYERALEDARRSIQLDPTYTKGYQRQAKCYLVMGEVATAVLCYDKLLEIDPTNGTIKSECQQAKSVQAYVSKADISYAKKDYRSVLFCMDKSIELSPECRKFRVLKAECLVHLKRYQEAQGIINDVIRQDSSNADAIYVRGLCLYYQDNVDKAYAHFQEVLRLAHDHTKAREAYKRAKVLAQKREEGNAAFKASNMQQAYDLYTEALAVDASNVCTNSKLLFNRALVSAKLDNPASAIDDCSKAIELDEGYVKAYLKRARCYMDTDQHDEAVRDAEKAFKLDKSKENKNFLAEAKLELKKSKRKDYYKMLGISKEANEDEIKKAYRKHALLHHPDRHMSATEDVKKAEEKKFKEIGEAYGILSDAKKKARYDSGQDLDEMEMGPNGFHDIDPNIIFQSFFGGGGHGFQQQHGGGFPGGFSFQFG